MGDLAKTLFDAAFSGPRDPRSVPYKAGVLAALRYRVDGARMTNPYPVATAESDAWYAGTQEGHTLFRRHAEQALDAYGRHELSPVIAGGPARHRSTRPVRPARVQMSAGSLQTQLQS